MNPFRFLCPACKTDLHPSHDGGDSVWWCGCLALRLRSIKDGSFIWSYDSMRSGVLSVETGADGCILYSRAFGPVGVFNGPVPASELEAAILLESVDEVMTS